MNTVAAAASTAAPITCARWSRLRSSSMTLIFAHWNGEVLDDYTMKRFSLMAIEH